MASVFLSYDRDDSDKARPIALALEKAGHSVWWDLHVRGGAQFSKVIEEALKAADAVVVLWSQNSVESAWVRDEAAAGRDSGRLVPATIDGTEAPLGFRQFQTIDMREWKRGVKSRGYKELEQAIAETATEPGSAKKEILSSAQSPANSSDRTRAGRRWLAAAALVLVVLAGALAVSRFSGRASSGPVIAVAAADRSPSSEALARDLLAKLGSLQAARTDALELVGSGGSNNPTFIFQASASGAATHPGGNLVLLSGRDRSLLWSKDFESPAGNQAGLEQSMAYTAGQVLDCAVQASARSAHLDDQTLKLFLNGCALYAERYFSDPSSVVPIFTRIVESAPAFQPAWTKLLLAEAQVTRAQMLFYDRFVPGELPRHIAAVSNLNPRLPELYVAKMTLLPFSALDQRFRLLDHAVALNPDDPNPLWARSFHEIEVGRNSDAVDDARRAAELDPLSPGFESNLIQNLAYSGQVAAAEQELRRAEQLWPGTAAISDARFRVTSRFGDAREALQMLHSAGFRQVYPTSDMEAYLLARIDPSKSNVDRAIAAAESPQLSERRRIAQVVQLLGDFGRENELYDMMMGFTAAQLTSARAVLFRPSLHKFRQDPRFMTLAARAGLIDFWRKTGKWPDFCFEPDLPYDCKKEAAKLNA